MQSLIAILIIAIALTICTWTAAVATPRKISRKIRTLITWTECIAYAIFLAIYKWAIVTYDIQTLLRQALTLLE